MKGWRNIDMWFRCALFSIPSTSSSGDLKFTCSNTTKITSAKSNILFTSISYTRTRSIMILMIWESLILMRIPERLSKDYSHTNSLRSSECLASSSNSSSWLITSLWNLLWPYLFQSSWDYHWTSTPNRSVTLNGGKTRNSMKKSTNSWLRLLAISNSWRTFQLKTRNWINTRYWTAKSLKLTNSFYC